MSQAGSSGRLLSSVIPEVLTELFEADGRTQAQIGAAAGMTQTELSRFLRGERVPHLDQLDAIATAFGTDVETVVARANRRR